MSQDHFLNLQPGTIINGRYEIVKCLGTGSMGMVYACRHRELAGHMVAMKVLFAEVARDSVAAARFRNEIVASYGVSHPNVVRAYEYFRDGDLIAFTMEYIGGGDLADRINREEPLAIDEIARMLSQMCSGVQAIHDAGIIHRDLKPENILLTAQGDIKITDFGIARMGSGGPKLTEHGGVVGTIDYVSPEYLERGQVDARSDVYALGVLAFEMITGESPFRGQSVIETMTMRLKTDPEPPHKLRPECPPALSNIVLKAMARDVDKRYQSAGEMFYDLNQLKGEILHGYQHSRPKSPMPQIERESVSGSAPPVTKPGAVSYGVSSGSFPTTGGGLGRGQVGSAGRAQNNLGANGAVGANTRSSPGKASPRAAGDAHNANTVLIDSGIAKSSVQSGQRASVSHRGGEQELLKSGGAAARSAASNQQFRTTTGSGASHATTSSVSISTGKMSPDRVKALMQDFDGDNGGGWLNTLLWGLVILVIGGTIGLGVMYLLEPDKFERIDSGRAIGSQTQATKQ